MKASHELGLFGAPRVTGAVIAEVQAVAYKHGGLEARFLDISRATSKRLKVSEATSWACTWGPYGCTPESGRLLLPVET